jgi:hypothetical protein
MREYGNPGLPPSANFSCGSSLIIDVGQRTDWQRGGSLIHCVTKRRRIFNISWWAVYFQEAFGSPSCRVLVLQHLPHNLLTNPLMIGGEKLIVLLVGTMSWV